MDRRSLIFVIGLTIALFFVNQWFSKDNTVQQQQKHVPKKIDSLQDEFQPPMDTLAMPALRQSANEELFVLKNDYQMVVFSNVGGAIAEINLPFQTKENTKSFVRPIHIDRLFEKEYSFDDHFPSFPYYINDGTGVKKVEDTALGGYYPLLRRTLFKSKDLQDYKSPSRLYALRVYNEATGVDSKIYTLKRLEKNLIEFELIEADRKINKVFSFPAHPDDAPYILEVTIRVDGDGRGMWLTSGVPEVELISDNPAPALSYRITKSNNKGAVESISLPKDCTVSTSIYPDWVCSSNGFFGLILDPITDIPPGYRVCKISGTEDPTRLSIIDPVYTPYPSEKYPGYEFQLPMRAQTLNLRYYAGPLEGDILKKVDQAYFDPASGYNPDYIAALSYQGWFTFISEPFAKFLFILMNLFYQVTSSWGISIILLTVALRIMLYPLNAWSIKSTIRMQEIAPKVSAIQEKFKKDPKRAQQEIMNLYREKGVNPLSGCFPLLIQLPFLIGMFDLLKSTFELRGASFIPGWIDNLTAPDVLFSWDFPLFFFGTDFHLLPFLLGGVMWAQQRFSATAPKDKSLMTDQQKQQRMMGNIMTIVFTVMFYHFPSGLNIYWLSSMALGILQQWMMTRKMMKKA
ncbi:MAG: membrane protein insertase YidC [Verrucomicrobia bacterium]|nr:membrane protein insertase YidC [Verrucomicrobiota bacterium]